jgi:hypothetical protein
VVGDQHRLADNERCDCGEHEIADCNGILGDEEIRRENNEVEADKKEYCRRQYFKEFVQKPGANPTYGPGSHP